MSNCWRLLIRTNSEASRRHSTEIFQRASSRQMYKKHRSSSSVYCCGKPLHAWTPDVPTLAQPGIGTKRFSLSHMFLPVLHVPVCCPAYPSLLFTTIPSAVVLPALPVVLTVPPRCPFCLSWCLSVHHDSPIYPSVVSSVTPACSPFPYMLSCMCLLLVLCASPERSLLFLPGPTLSPSILLCILPGQKGGSPLASILRVPPLLLVLPIYPSLFIDVIVV